jgi:putative hydrolase of the HAD superfamily
MDAGACLSISRGRDRCGCAAVDWSAIDTVLLDMDGTLLDLRFDNWFWREYVPAHYARARDLDPAAAWGLLEPKFRAVVGTMNWYCLDYWSRELQLDIAALKREVRHEVRFLPGAEQFLRRLASTGKRRVLVTNAHPETLAIKTAHVPLGAHFDASHSAHGFSVPKEDPRFWARFRAHEPFDPARTLLVDDSVAVLESARRHGIAWLRAIRQPDSARPAHAVTGFLAVDRIAELL